MKTNLNRYRLAGVAGGLLLGAGQFWGLACVLQLFAFLPLMVFALRDKRPRWAALAGLYMGIAYTIPQMVYLRMPVPVTAILLVWMTILLIGLCMCIAIFLPGHLILGPLMVGATWYILDWVNYTAVPVWGMAQSFARSWTAYPFAIQFISITGISGVLFVIAALQGLAVFSVAPRLWPAARNRATRTAVIVIVFVLAIIASIDAFIWIQKPADSLKVAAAGWVFDDRSVEISPHDKDGFEELFAAPARDAAAQGARVLQHG